MAFSLERPIAVRLGLTLVSVQRSREGWTPIAWSPVMDEPSPIFTPADYETAVDHALAYAALRPSQRVLSLPLGRGDAEGRGRVHVLPSSGGKLEVLHESASGNSFGSLASYPAGDGKRALRFALGQLVAFANPMGASRLGDVVI
jgi:hypothetical protein